MPRFALDLLRVLLRRAGGSIDLSVDELDTDRDKVLVRLPVSERVQRFVLMTHDEVRALRGQAESPAGEAPL